MYPLALDTAYFDLLSSRPDWSRVLDRYRIDVIVWPKQSSLTQLLRSDHAWRLVRTDKLAATFVRI